jgi:uncharacterized tellurite resistance protein B-like protein
MTTRSEEWTQSHDLALVYIALAYGSDNELDDEELATITEILQAWRPDLEPDEVQDVVMEALSVYLDGESDQEVLGAMVALKKSFTEPERIRAIEDVVRIAEVDGMLLRSERSLISLLADAWDVKATAERLLTETVALQDDRDQWSLMHDIGLVYLVMAHSTDNDLSDPEISAIIGRLHDWQPGMEEEKVRGVLREALTYYAKGPDKQALTRSVGAIREALPVVQRLALLDDLAYIAESDGHLTDHEREMLASLSAAWGISTRLNGTAGKG